VQPWTALLGFRHKCGGYSVLWEDFEGPLLWAGPRCKRPKVELSVNAWGRPRARRCTSIARHPDDTDVRRSFLPALCQIRRRQVLGGRIEDILDGLAGVEPHDLAGGNCNSLAGLGIPPLVGGTGRCSKTQEFCAFSLSQPDEWGCGLHKI
jgi:hypothetical protein